MKNITTTIKLKIGDIELELTLEQAKELKAVLDELLPQTKWAPDPGIHRLKRDPERYGNPPPPGLPTPYPQWTTPTPYPISPIICGQPPTTNAGSLTPDPR